MLRWGFVNLIGQFIRIMISLICIPILISYMGLELYGLWSWSITILAVVQLSEGGLSTGMLYFYSREGTSDKFRNIHFTSSLILLIGSSFVVICIIFIFSPYLIETVKGVSIELQSEISIVIKIGAFLVSLRIIQSLFWAILQAEGRYELYSFLNTTQIVATNFAWIGLAFTKIKYLPYYIYTSLLIGILTTILLFLFTSQTLRNFRWNFNFSKLKIFFNYNMAAWGSSVGSAVFTQGDKLVIANILGPVALGIYFIFTNICVQLNQVIGQVVHPLFPIISSYHQKSELEYSNILSSVSQMFLINIYLALVGAGTLIVFSEEILMFFLKQEFQQLLVIYFCILVGIYGLYSLAVTGHYILMGQGKSKKVMQITVLSGVSVLACVYIFSMYCGLLGAVLGNLAYLLIIKLLYDGMNSIYGNTTLWIKYITIPLILLSTLIILVFTLELTLLYKAALYLIFLLVLLNNFYKKYTSL